MSRRDARVEHAALLFVRGYCLRVAEMPHVDHQEACVRASRLGFRCRELPSNVWHRQCGASTVSRVQGRTSERTGGAAATAGPRSDDSMASFSVTELTLSTCHLVSPRARIGFGWDAVRRGQPRALRLVVRIFDCYCYIQYIAPYCVRPATMRETRPSSVTTATICWIRCNLLADHG